MTVDECLDYYEETGVVDFEGEYEGEPLVARIVMDKGWPYFFTTLDSSVEDKVEWYPF